MPLVNSGIARIQIQGYLTPEAMFFELYHIEGEITKLKQSP